MSVLPKLRDRQQMTALIRSGELEVEGDIQVVQNFVALSDQAEFDPAELLAPYIGDIAAEGISKTLRTGSAFLRKGLLRQQRYAAEVLTEEWRMAPGPLEVARFAEETAAVERAVDALTKRLENWRANDAGEIRRLYFIVRTFLSYGLDELIPRMRITLPLRLWRRTLFWMPNRHKDQELGARLRLALQELGPVWIKFGQMLSTRRDLFHRRLPISSHYCRIASLRLTRESEETNRRSDGQYPHRDRFDDFDIQPLASASIAQVHTARLKENGKEVVIKVIRPDILPVIKADMKLIYRPARWVPRLLPDGRRLRPLEVVREYEKR